MTGPPTLILHPFPIPIPMPPMLLDGDVIGAELLIVAVSIDMTVCVDADISIVTVVGCASTE